MNKRLRRKESYIAILFLTPSLAGFTLFFLVPFFIGFYYSLLDSPVDGSFVGLDNYDELLHNSVFRRAAYNTFKFTVISVPLNMLCSLLLAQLLNRTAFLRGWLRIGFIAPLVVPVASVVLVWQIIFHINGALNGSIAAYGGAPQDWLESPDAPYIIILIYLWKNIGYNMILFLAGLQNIPTDYYEAASMDGAGKLRQWITITLVYLTPTTFFVFIISIINSFKAFRETYMLAGNYPNDSVYMLQHFMNNMFKSLDYQKLTSAAFLMAVIIVILVFVFFQVEKRLRESID